MLKYQKKSVIIIRNTYQIIFYVLLLLIHSSHVCVYIHICFENNEINIRNKCYRNKVHKITNVYII